MGEVFYTTGVWAAVAAKGAVLALLGFSPRMVEVEVPRGDRVSLPLVATALRGEEGCARVVKEGGEARDVTKGMVIEAKARFSKRGVVISGGKGVGVVTRRGLKVPVGEHAINPVPRVTILRAIGDVLSEHGLEEGVEVVIEVPQGERLALGTANPRVGVVGGISILGTRGTVVPYSTRSFLDSIKVELRVARAQGLREVVLSPGRASRERAMDILPQLPTFAFVEVGDFVAFAAREVGRMGFSMLHLVAQPGKMAKVAMGFRNTHAKRYRLDMRRLADMLERPEVCYMNTARQAYFCCEGVGWERVVQEAERNLSQWAGGMQVEAHLLPPE